MYQIGMEMGQQCFFWLMVVYTPSSNSVLSRQHQPFLLPRRAAVATSEFGQSFSTEVTLIADATWCCLEKDQPTKISYLFIFKVDMTLRCFSQYYYIP